MTNEQRANAIAIARAIRNGRDQVTESFAIGQVMLVTGCPYDKAVKGLQAMRNEKLFEGFIERKTDGVLGRMLEKNPTLGVLIARLDLVPGRCDVLAFRPFAYPAPAIAEKRLNELKKRLFKKDF